MANLGQQRFSWRELVLIIVHIFRSLASRKGEAKSCDPWELCRADMKLSNSVLVHQMTGIMEVRKEIIQTKLPIIYVLFQTSFYYIYHLLSLGKQLTCHDLDCKGSS